MKSFTHTIYRNACYIQQTNLGKVEIFAITLLSSLHVIKHIYNQNEYLNEL